LRRRGVLAALLLAAALVAVLLGAALATNASAVLDAGSAAQFYAVVPHAAMVALFGGVGLFVLTALAIGVRRFRRDTAASAAVPSTQPVGRGAALRALRDSLTLRHLHPGGEDCATGESARSPLRRWLHHATFYGFVLCFASTCVAAVYHFAGAPAPYAYTSVPVLLGAIGGVGLLVGPLGFWLRARDPALSDASQAGLDRSFIMLLLLTSATGLLLLLLRHQAAMGVLLLVHLGCVLALFVTLPYGKFVHGLYRAAALLKYAKERTPH
jgi:citrate/tricarballylate utilization protein